MHSKAENNFVLGTSVSKQFSKFNAAASEVLSRETRTVNLITCKGIQNFKVKDIEDELLQSFSLSGIIFRHYSSVKVIKSERGEIFFILVEENISILVENLKHPSSKESFYLIILISWRSHLVGDIFKLFWKFQIYNVNIMHGDKNGAISVKTFMPFNSRKCNDTSAVTINKFKDGRFVKSLENFFPNKMQNLHECQVRVATSNNSTPYVFLNKFVNGSFHLYGRDIFLAETLSKVLNFRINYTYFGQEGSLYENGTAEGTFKMLLEDKADLILADFWLLTYRLKFVDSSLPYFSQKIVFNIPPGAELSTLEKFLRPFDVLSWSLLIIYIFIGCIVIFLIRKASRKIQACVFGDDIRDPFMNFLVAIFGGSQHKGPTRNFARSLLIIFLVFCLVIRTLYTGSLYKFLQSNVYHKEVQSIDEMIERDFKIYHPVGTHGFYNGVQSQLSKRY